MKNDESVYLQHILDAVFKIESYIKGSNEEAFYKNTLIQDGVIRQIEIIGEAVKRLSFDLKDTHSHTLLRSIYHALRSKLNSVFPQLA